MALDQFQRHLLLVSSSRLFRQELCGDWEADIKEAKAALDTVLGQAAGGRDPVTGR